MKLIDIKKTIDGKTICQEFAELFTGFDLSRYKYFNVSEFNGRVDITFEVDYATYDIQFYKNLDEFNITATKEDWGSILEYCHFEKIQEILKKYKK